MDKYLPQLLAIDPDCEFIIKEKYGLLRIWTNSKTHSRKEFRNLEIEAEKESASICEVCGEPGKIRTDMIWIRTLCDECAAMESDERYEKGRAIAIKLLLEE